MSNVASIGFFDGVHLGHRHLIRQVTDEAHRRGCASLLVTFDHHPRTVFAPDTVPPLLTSHDEKLRLLRDAGADAVHVLQFDRALAALTARQFMADVLRNTLDVDALIIGYDHRFGRRQPAGATPEGFHDYARYGSELGIDVILATVLSSAANVSSSAIRRLLCQGDVHEAGLMLGRPYSWTGRVVHGHAIGRQLGFPTANLSASDAHKLLPARGAYAVLVDGAGSAPLPAMLNIGTRPTIDGGATSIEAHLLDFHDNLYGRTLTLHFIARLRPEQQFESAGALARQLEEDAARTRTLLCADSH